MTAFFFVPWTTVSVQVVGQVELGELLCDNLEDAPGSTLLRFAISSKEVRGVRMDAGQGIAGVPS